jgi:tetratricopeptide (TPR) repeat protein
MEADITNLRKLVEIVGLDPKYFYYAAKIRNIDLSSQDLTGMDLTGADFSGARCDFATRVDPEFRRLPETALTANDFQQVLRANERAELGDKCLEAGNFDVAMQAYRGSLEVRERLAARDPENAGWQRDLSASYGKIGDVLKLEGIFSEALQAYRTGFETRERLAAKEPDNAERQRDLSVSYDKIGNVHQAKGDLDGALQAFISAKKFNTLLANGNLESIADWEKDLADDIESRIHGNMP